MIFKYYQIKYGISVVEVVYLYIFQSYFSVDSALNYNNCTESLKSAFKVSYSSISISLKVFNNLILVKELFVNTKCL